MMDQTPYKAFRRLCYEFARTTRGVAIVEMALILPILLALLFGIVSYGSWLGLSHAVQQGANERARAALGGLSQPERAQLAEHTANSALVRSYDLDPAKIAVTVQDDGQTIVVDVTYDASANPLLSLPFAPLPSKRIERQSAVMLNNL